LIEAIPEARELRRLRSALIEVVQGRSGPASVNEALSSIREPAELVETIRRVLAGSPPPGNPSTPAPRPEPPAATISPSPGASLFDLVDVEGSRERGGGAGSRASGDTLRTHDSVRRGLDGLIEGLLGLSHSPDAPSPATIGRLLSETDRAIAGVVRATLFDTGFQSLETAWLSLRFLVRRLDFRTGVGLHVLSVDRTRLLDAMREVTLPFLEGLRAEGRLACVLLDFPFGGAAEDVADLTEIAGLAAEARTPIVAAADPAILGIRSLEEIHALPDLSDFFETTGREDWGALRMREETRWLSLCMNRFLLRSPYGKDADQVKGFEFEEILDGMESSAAATQGVWGRPVWLMGALVSDSFARTGWGVEITGPGHGGSIGDLPVHPLELRTGEIVQSPIEILPSESRVLELSRAGIITFVASRNTDRAFITSAPSFFRAARTDDRNEQIAEARRATLPYQFFLSQILAWTESIWRNLEPNSNAEDVARTLAAGLQFLLLGHAGPTARVSGEAIRGGAETTRISLRVEPSGEPLRGLPPVALELALPGI
jgi:type VI secretion system protein ImpC